MRVTLPYRQEKPFKSNQGEGEGKGEWHLGVIYIKKLPDDDDDDGKT